MFISLTSKPVVTAARKTSLGGQEEETQTQKETSRRLGDTESVFFMLSKKV